MQERYMTILRAKLAELRRLLDQTDLSAETAQAIRTELERMERIIAEYE